MHLFGDPVLQLGELLVEEGDCCSSRSPVHRFGVRPVRLVGLFGPGEPALPDLFRSRHVGYRQHQQESNDAEQRYLSGP